MQLQGVLLAVLISTVSVLAQDSEDFKCRDTPAECTVNPCDTERCPRYTSRLTCCPEVADGACVARFYRPGTTRAVDPDTCYRGIEYCEDKECNRNRICAEEVIPCTGPNCDFQRVQAKCEIRPELLPVADCSMVSCING